MVKFMLIAAILMSAAPAVASGEAKKKQTDPNRIICRTEEVIGSRLQSKRRCLSATEWTQMETDQRNSVERIQVQKTLPGG